MDTKNTDLKSVFLKNFEKTKKELEHNTTFSLPARYGRILNQNKIIFAFQLLLFLIIWVFITDNFESLSYYISYFTLEILKYADPYQQFQISQKQFFFNTYIYYISSTGKLPSLPLVIYCLVFSLLVMILINTLKNIPKFLQLWINFLLITLIFSCFYFLFFPYSFPYTLNDLSILYITVQIGIILISSFLIGISLSFLSFRKFLVFSNLFIFLLIIAYSFIFGVFRYTVFLYILKNYSFLWALNLYFNFGPLLDMIYISAIWGGYLSFVAKYIKGTSKYWRWLY